MVLSTSVPGHCLSFTFQKKYVMHESDWPSGVEKGLGSIRPIFCLTISENIKVCIILSFTDTIKAKHYCSKILV